MISKSRRDSAGGGKYQRISEFFRDLQEPTWFSGGGVVAGFFRGLQCEIKILPNIK